MLEKQSLIFIFEGNIHSMVKYLLYVVLFFSAASSYAQSYLWGKNYTNNQNWAWNNLNTCNSTNFWANQSGNQNMRTDRNGNIYIIGNFWWPITIGTQTIQPACMTWQCQDFYVAKYDSSGNMLWVQAITGPNREWVNGLDVDQYGNVYLSGTIGGPVSFGSINVTPSNQDAFIAKLNANGTWAWVKSFGSLMGFDCGSAVTVDRFGNVFLAGSFSGQALLVPGNGNTLILSSNEDIQCFIAKYNPSGNLIWVRTGGSQTVAGSNQWAPVGDFTTDIAVDHMGNAYLAGSYLNNATFGSVTIPSSGPNNGFVVKYGPTGTVQWGVSLGKEVKAIAVDQSGHLYYTGVFNTVSTIGSTTLTPYYLDHNDVFIGKVFSNGNHDWVRVFGSNERIVNASNWYDDGVSDITLDQAGNIFLTGVISDTTAASSVCEINKSLGDKNCPWGNCWDRNPFLIKLNNSGNCEWNIIASDTGANYSYWSTFNSVEVDDRGTIYATGRRWNNWNDPAYFFCKNNDTLNPMGVLLGGSQTGSNSSEFILKLKDREFVNTDSTKIAYCVGDSIKIPYSRFGLFNNNNVFTAQLSDSSGGFDTPLNLGSITGNNSDTIRAVLPTTLKPSESYRLRVNASLPGVLGFASEYYITISAWPNSAAGIDATICRGDSIKLNGSGGKSFEWTPNIWLQNNKEKEPFAEPDTTVDYILAASNPGGCVDFDTVRITVVPKAIAKTITDSSICFKDSIALNPFGSITGITYRWSPAAGLNDSTISAPKASPADNTIYKLKVSNPYCSDSASVSITVKPLPTVVVGNDTNICGGDSAVLHAITDGNIFQWTPNANVNNLTFSNTKAKPSATTVFQLIATGINGCSAKDSMKVNVNPKPTINKITDKEICPGDSVALTTTSTGSSFNWSPDIDLSSNIVTSPIAFPKVDRRYNVTISLGSCTDTSSVFIKVKPKPVAQAGNDTTICQFETITLNGSGGVEYKWDNDPTINDLTIGNPNASPVSSGYYFLTVTNTEGCNDKDSVQITVNTLPPAYAGNDTTICFGAKLKLNASGGIQYKWLPESNIDDANINDPVVNPFDDDWYMVRVKDNKGCFKNDSIHIVVRDPVDADAGHDEDLCRGSFVQLTATGGNSYEWSPAIAMDNSAIAKPTVSPLNDITYAVKVTDAFYCVGFDSVKINIMSLPIANAGKDSNVCKGERITLISEYSAEEYEWSTGSTKSSSTLSPTSDVLVKLRIKDANCWSSWDSVRIRMAPYAQISYTADPEKNVVPAEIRFTNKTTGARTFRWDFGDSAGYSIDRDPVYTYQRPGLYPVTLTAVTDRGCKSSETLRSIYVDEGFKMFIPTAFTPNGNGLNDVFSLSFTGVESMTGEIYNQWGQKVHRWHSSELPYAYWDGTYMGEPALPGVYSYVIKVKTLGGETQLIKGNVTLLR